MRSKRSAIASRRSSSVPCRAFLRRTRSASSSHRITRGCFRRAGECYPGRRRFAPETRAALLRLDLCVADDLSVFGGLVGDIFRKFRRRRTDRLEAEASETLANFRLRQRLGDLGLDRKSTRLNSSHVSSSYAVVCLKKKSNRIEL